MCSKKIVLLLIIFSQVFAACGRKAMSGDIPTCWGKTNYYDSFLWKKHVPDTLYRTIEFDFNQDAKNFMTEPLKLRLFKKTDSDEMSPVTESEMEVFVDGRKCQGNILDIYPGTEKLSVGLVFNPDAENKVHHWFFKPAADGGLDRINDMGPDIFNADNSSLLDIEVEKHRVMNPLKEGMLFAAAILIASLLVWIFVLKPIIFPTFRVGRVQLSDPVPYSSLKHIRGYRKVILTDKKQKQNVFNKFFTGKILYDVNQLWISDIIIEPKDKKSVRLRCTKDFMVDARVLKTNQEYTIQNMVSGKKTKIKIS